MDSVARSDREPARRGGFSIRQLSDALDLHPDEQATPGSWEHYTAFAPPRAQHLSRLDN